jgi:hypothetical protein
MSLPALAELRHGAGHSRGQVRDETLAEPSQSPTRARWVVASGLAVVFALFGARCVGVARSSSITSDESTHLVHGMHFWLTGDDLGMWELGTPRLPHLVDSYASYQALRAAGMVDGATHDVRSEVTQIVLSGIPRALRPARYVAIAWGIALLGAVYWATARRCGVWLGLGTTAIVAFVPEVLAHSALAGSDVPFAVLAVLSLGLMARYMEQPSPGRWCGLALTIGLAWAVRHTAILLILLAGGAHAICALRAPRMRGVGEIAERLCATAWATAGLAVIAFMVLWAGDGFGTVSLAEASASITRMSVPDRLGTVDISSLPVPTSALSLLKQVSHQGRGHEAYFCGEVAQQGWTLYFPVAFLLKTPVGLIGLIVLAAARVRPNSLWERLCLAFLCVLWVSLVRSKVNIGLRYALLTYPLLAPCVARLFEPRLLRDWIWAPATVAAALWFSIASIAAHPRYLSYFNELAGGPKWGWVYLADSNIDWGQDFDALARTLKRLNINDVTTDVSSERRLIEPGLVAIPNPSRELQPSAETLPNRRLYDSEGGAIPVFTRYVAVSVSRLLGLYSRNDMSWLRTRRIVQRVGDSIFIFDMEQPADRPFCP